MSAQPTTILVLLFIAVPPALTVAGESNVRFNRDVRPILSENCLACHGPDEATRQAELRLDRAFPVVNDAKSERDLAAEIARRITSGGDDRMPPPETTHRLSPPQVDILLRWLKAGAEFEPHWAFLPPRRPALPPVDSAWCQNPIDHFVLARLHARDLQPAAPAPPHMLIRRVTYDLTGLPPSLTETRAFLKQSQIAPETAYLSLVNRLLASSRYGEHWARSWLDAARYADTNGYFTDNERTMWPWRDWVIQALNDNMPFDQFTIEQLAGDLLAHPSESQRIATGFNRNHMVNNETGIIEAEFLAEYVADRVDTTASVWLGLTVGCARCHDHKYDPLSQIDYYRLFAHFNQLPERGLSGSQGNSAPSIPVTFPQLEARIASVKDRLIAARSAVKSVQAELNAAQRAWEEDGFPTGETTVRPTGSFSFDELNDLRVVGKVELTEGLHGNAATFDGAGCLDLPTAFPLQRTSAFSVSAWVHPRRAGCILSKMDDQQDMRGFDVAIRKNKIVANLVHRWKRNAIRVQSLDNLPSGKWSHLAVTYDGSSRAAGLRLFLNGEPVAASIEHDHLQASVATDAPWRIGRRQSSASYYGLIDDVAFYKRALAPAEVRAIYGGEVVASLAKGKSATWSDQQATHLRSWFLQNRADPILAKPLRELAKLESQLRALQKMRPSAMVMQDAAKVRATHVLVRGEYNKLGQAVRPGIPEVLGSPNAEAEGASTRNRLDLARWIVAADNPLTARVAVNRYWHNLFGVGLVKTVDDFGTQGELPTHPQLLDWLATEFVKSQWDVKQLLRLLVTSATYRQSSDAPPASYHQDPENRWLSRGPRIRLTAEEIRDSALAISGLLEETVGGPGVYPYQPAGLWTEVTYDGNQSYVQSRGADLYRRGLYSFWKRQAPPPSMLIFDAPTRETCTLSRSRTNTPLQALVLLNDPAFVETARRFAERVLQDSRDESPDARASLAFEMASNRKPNQSERSVLVKAYRRLRAAFESTPANAGRVLRVGEANSGPDLDPIELAAWTGVCNMILCLDEVISKP